EVSPRAFASRRRIRTHAEWNVETHIVRAAGPTRDAILSCISFAALFVKVIARISPGRARPVRSVWAMRRVSTLVFPEPAPATMSRGVPVCRTASRWAGLRPSRRASAESPASDAEAEAPAAAASPPAAAGDGDAEPAAASAVASASGRGERTERKSKGELIAGRTYQPERTRPGSSEPGRAERRGGCRSADHGAGHCHGDDDGGDRSPA